MRLHPLTTRPLPARILPSLAFACGAALLAAQLPGQDPPATGFPLTEKLDLALTFGDAQASRTKADARYPSTTAPVTGWPVVIVVHDLGLSRKSVAEDCKRYARQGYLTVAYDVRGQGDARTLSPASGSTFGGKEERLDLAEVVAWIGTAFGGSPLLADVARIAVAGSGQGGLMAWAAAAWSGKTLPSQSRGITKFPAFAAALPSGFCALHESVLVPGGNMLETNLLQMLWYGTGVTWDTTFQSTLQGHIDAEAFSSVAALFANDVWLQDRAMLASSTVPVSVTVGWASPWNVVQGTLDSLAALPLATPRTAQLDAGVGPGATTNDRQLRFVELREERWLARFLKARQNGIDAEARFQASLPDPTGIENPTVLLWNRNYDAWPPPGNASVRYWLRSGQQLAQSAPAGVETPDTLGNQVATGFTIKEFIRQAQLAPTATLAKIPRSTWAWDSPPLAADLELAGPARVELEVSTTATTVFVQCVLLDVPPGGGERFVTSGVVAVRGAPSAPTKLVVTTSPVQMRFPAGHTLRLRTENLPLRQTAVLDEVAVAPVFSSYSMLIEHSAARPSFLELSTRGGIMPALSSHGVPSLYVTAPQDVRYRLDAPAALGGSFYFALWTLSGTATATPLPGSDPARMTVDPFTIALTEPSTPIATWFGYLSPAGAAFPSLHLPVLAPLPAITVGKRVSALGVVWWGNYLLASNPVDIEMR